MTIFDKDLSADPLILVRSLPIKWIAPDKIYAQPDAPTDQLFLAKYSGFLQGKSPIHQTRVSLETVRRGIWKCQDGRWNLIHREPSEENVDYVIRMIRSGERPVLHLYESPCPHDEFRWICSDDLVTHAAYQRLGIKKVPAALMGKPKNLEESALSIRCFARGKKNRIQLVDGLVPVVPKLVPSLLGAEKSDTVECLTQLIEFMTETKARVRSFHQPGESAQHYHHTLYSILLRAIENLEGMKFLIEAGKILAATALLRSMYELALMFYVDWLAPSLTYKYLQMASVMSESDWEARCNAWQKDDVANGASGFEAKCIRDAHMRGIRLARVVSERARLFPLGEDLHRDVYRFLSDVVHHDFSVTARYAHALESGDDAIYFKDVEHTLSHLTDILAAAIITRIQDDIGLDEQHR